MPLKGDEIHYNKTTKLLLDFLTILRICSADIIPCSLMQ